MVRLWIGGLLWVACTLVGIGVGNSYKKREKFWDEWKEFCLVMSNSIKNLRMSQSKIIEKYVMDKKGQFIEFLVCYDQYLNSQIKDTKKLDELVKNTPLFKKEYKYLKEFVQSLGKVDFNMQVDILNYQCNLVDRMADISKKQMKSNGLLWYKLGFVIGLVIMILVV